MNFLEAQEILRGSGVVIQDHTIIRTSGICNWATVVGGFFRWAAMKLLQRLLLKYQRCDGSNTDCQMDFP